MAEVLESRGRSWVKVRVCHDQVEGWMATNQLTPISPSEYENYRDDFAYVGDLFQPIMGDDYFLPLTIGARLPLFDGMRFNLGLQQYTFSGQAIQHRMLSPTAELVIKLARRLLHVPFLWGGRTPTGIDSAALVQLAFSLGGIDLPRTTEAQVQCGRTVDFIEQARPGDIAFFNNQSGRIAHTGILLPDSQIIHTAERVRIDAVDHFGIFNYEMGRYTHRLRIVKRLLPDPPAGSGPARKAVAGEVVENQIALF